MRTVFISSTALAVGLLAGIALTHYQYRPTHPKAPSSIVASGPVAPPSPQLSQPSFDQWDPFSDLRTMQKEMDQMFANSITRFRGQKGLKGFTDTPGYSLSLDVRDLNDHFEVHASLPETKTSDIDVKLTDDHTLEVNVSNKVSSNDKQSSSTSWGQYAQTIQLPSPVKVDKMKVERHEHDLLIVLPKSNA